MVQKYGEHQLRLVLVVYLHYLQGIFISQVAVWDSFHQQYGTEWTWLTLEKGIPARLKPLQICHAKVWGGQGLGAFYRLLFASPPNDATYGNEQKFGSLGEMGEGGYYGVPVLIYRRSMGVFQKPQKGQTLMMQKLEISWFLHPPWNLPENQWLEDEHVLFWEGFGLFSGTVRMFAVKFQVLWSTFDSTWMKGNTWLLIDPLYR